MTYTDHNEDKTADSEHQIPSLTLTAERLLGLWEAKTDSRGAIIVREPDGLLGVRTGCTSLTLLASFYSPLHRRTIQKALRKFSRRQAITPAAIETARKEATEFYRECCAPSALGSRAAQRLKANERATLRQLADIYYESDHFAGLKNGKTKLCRKANIENYFLAYTPQGNGRAKLKFADRQLVRLPLNSDDLDSWKADTLARYDGRPHVLNRTSSYLTSMFKWLAANHYLPASAIPNLPKAPESPE